MNDGIDSMDQAREYNRSMDEFLSRTNSIPHNIWKSFYDAISYDNVTTVTWAVKKLRILYQRMQSGDEIYVDHLSSYMNMENFEAVIQSEFSRFIYELIIEQER